jgi:DNA polymerase V
VSIGIASSKTLAKLASETAKQHEQWQGAVSFIDMPAPERDACLEATPIKDVWGVGRRLAPMLRGQGVSNALALSRLAPRRAQQLMGINGRQLVAELNGINCHALEPVQSKPQSIMRSRTFGEDTGQPHVLEAAVATLGAQGAFQLRQAGLLARRVGLFTNTSRHKPGYRKWMQEVRLTQPTNDTGQIISVVAGQLQAIYNSGQAYHRLGVFLADFVPEDSLQTDLLGVIDIAAHDRSQARMQVLDTINRKYGRGRLRYAAEDLSNTWQPKHHIRSPRYVSQWDELPEAHIR